LFLYCLRTHRYAKFLLLRKHHLELQHPIPPLDIALMWTSHMSCSGLYAADCQQSLQRLFLDLPGAGASPWIERDVTGPWRFHWTDTQRAWLDEFEGRFGQAPYARLLGVQGLMQGWGTSRLCAADCR
jgi:hypothetical protein